MILAQDQMNVQYNKNVRLRPRSHSLRWSALERSN